MATAHQPARRGNEVAERLNNQKVLLLDGGLATELERRGHNIDDPLWSARVLLEHPEAIEQLHFDYLTAGAECLLTANYQATFAGLAARGLDRKAAADLMLRAVRLAQRARERWLAQTTSSSQPPLVAASIGPYGAYLHDGSEYRGDYGLSIGSLVDFHRDRFSILAHSGADLLACETIPCLAEAEALVRLLEELSPLGAWFSFTCKDAAHLCHGEPLAEAAAMLDQHPGVLAVGVNCTAPELIVDLIGEVRRGTRKPVVVYPNSGESWDPQRRCWSGSKDADRFAERANSWVRAGARLIGGCCRTGPEHIRALTERLPHS